MFSFKSCLISPGHSLRSAGAIVNGLNEYEFNVLQAKILYDFFTSHSITAKIIDPAENNLVKIGSAADSHYCFIETHLNSSLNPIINYCSCCVDKYFSNVMSATVASDCATQMAKALNLPLYQGKILGVYPRELAVLKAASHTNNILAFITEPFFLSAYSNKLEVEKLCNTAMTTLGETLLEYLK